MDPQMGTQLTDLINKSGSVLTALNGTPAVTWGGTVTTSAEGYATATHTFATAGTGVVGTILAANANRKYLLLVNDSDETIYVSFTSPAALNRGIRLNALGGNYEASKQQGNINTLQVLAICASGGKNITVLEGT